MPYVEGHDLVVENESESILAEEQDDKFLSLQRRSMLLPETSFKEEEEEDEDFFEEEADDDDDNDSFITINTSDEDSDCSDETLENSSESNDSGVIEEPEFIISSSKAGQSSYEVNNQPPQRSYGVNPIFAAHFNSQFEQDSLDGNAVAASREFKYVKNTKWKPAAKSKKLQKTRKYHAKDNLSSTAAGVVIGNEVGEVSKLSAMRENETFAYNESCLI